MASIYQQPDYNKNVYSFDTVKADATYTGKLLMRQEIMKNILKMNPKPTKAVVAILEMIQAIELDVPNPFEKR